MADITQTYMNNLGGIQEIKFIHKQNINNIPSSIDHVITESAITFAAGESWNVLYFTADTAKPTIELKEDSFGNHYFEIQLQCNLPKDASGITKLLEQLKRYRHILRIEDKNGQVTLWGTTTNPLKAMYNIVKGKKAADYNGYRITFKTQAIKPPYYLE